MSTTSEPEQEHAEIHTTVRLRGSVPGQVVAGDNKVVVRVDTVHGDLVLPTDVAPSVTPRPAPIGLLPRWPDPWFGRAEESARAVDDVAAGRPVAITGERGVGKSSLLRFVANRVDQVSTGGGVVFSAERGLSGGDIPQVLFEMFYASVPPMRPSRTDLQHRLRDRQAVILFDDTELDPAELRELQDLAPACDFVVTTARHGPGTTPLAGLRPSEARSLLAHTLGRDLTQDEMPAADALCVLARCVPAAVVELGAAARTYPGPLVEFARRARASGLTPAPEPVGEDARLLGALAAVPGIALEAAQLAAITGTADAAVRLRHWVEAGVVIAAVAPGAVERYRLAGAGPPGSERWRSKLLEHVTGWVRAHPGIVLRPGVELENVRLLFADAGQRRDWRTVLALGAILDAAYTVSGRWDAWQIVLSTMLEGARALSDQATEALALHQLGVRALCTGDVPAAASALGSALALREKVGDDRGAAVTRQNLALVPPPPPPPFLTQLLRPRVAAWVALVAVLVVIAVGTVGSTDPSTDPSTTVSTAAVSLDRPLVQFAAQPLNRPSAPQTLIVSNTGGLLVHITGSRMEGAQADDFRVTETDCVRLLAPGGTCSADIVFTPVGDGARTANLILEVAEMDDEPVAALAGSTTDDAGPVAVRADPAQLIFAEQKVSTSSAVQPVRITASPAGTVPFGTVAVEGPDAADFAVTSDTCSQTRLPAGRFCTVRIRFAPAAAGPRTALLRLSTSDGAALAAVPLRGSGRVTVPPGDTTVTVPEVAGQALDAARSVIQGKDLTVGTVTREASATVPVHVVITSTPPGGATVERGSAVALTVSSGPVPCTVPNVVGQLAPAAKEKLRNSCVSVGAEVERPSVTVPVGVVITTVPAADTPVEQGSRVTLVVSSGFPCVRTPPLQGLRFDAAEAALTNAGFVVGTVTNVGVTGDFRIVDSSTPPSGACRPRGTKVDLVVHGEVG